MRAWKDFATLVKTRNLDGRFVARAAADLPFVLEVGMRVAFVPPQLDLPREGAVDHVRELDGGAWEVGFDTVRDREVARGLAGCHCLVRREDLPGIAPVDQPEGLVGWAALDARGEIIGEVTALVENPAHPLFEIERADGRGSALIPLVEEFVAGIDEDACEIMFDLPAGLLDL